MPDREKVIKGLECCVSGNTAICERLGCPYADEHEGIGDTCIDTLMADALALLKAQEPRVMKVGEVRNWVNSDRVTREPVAIEMRGGICAWIIDDEVREIPGEENLSSDLYGKTWRCWTSRPDEKRRAETPWESIMANIDTMVETDEQRKAIPWQAPSTSDSAPNG